MSLELAINLNKKPVRIYSTTSSGFSFEEVRERKN